MIKVVIVIVTMAASFYLAACGTIPAEWEKADAKINVKEKSALKSVGEGSEDKKICKKTRKTGSQLNKTLCLTEAEWEKMAEDAKARTKHLQDSSARSIRSTGGGG